VTASFYQNEITPRCASSGPRSAGFAGDESIPQVVRALLEGQFLNMKIHSQWLGVQPTEVYLTGGASQNNGIAQLVADVFGCPSARLSVAGSAGLGAAMRAAAACGANITELESAFCAPDPGSTMMPRVADYTESESQLKTLIASYT